MAQKEADKWMMISDTAKLQTERAEFELEEAERLKKELLGEVDGDDYLKEQGVTLVSDSTMDKDFNGNGGNVEAAAEIGKKIAAKALEKGQGLEQSWHL